MTPPGQLRRIEALESWIAAQVLRGRIDRAREVATQLAIFRDGCLTDSEWGALWR